MRKYKILSLLIAIIFLSTPCYGVKPPDMLENTAPTAGDWLIVTDSAYTTTKKAKVSAVFAAGVANQFSPEWYGAVGNGSTDDTAAWAALSSAAPEGSTIFVPGGKDYYINTSGGVIFTKTVHLVGSGGFTIGSGVGNNPGITVSGDNSVLEGFSVSGYVRSTFDGSEGYDTNLRRAVKVTGANVKTLRINVTDAENGIDYSHATGGEISGCRITNSIVYKDAIIPGSAPSAEYGADCFGISVHATNDVSIHDNYISGYSQNILLGSVPLRTKINNNNLHLAANNGIYQSSGHNSICTGNHILNANDSAIKVRGYRNQIIANKCMSDSASGTTTGIGITGNGTSGTGWNGDDILVQGNLIQGEFNFGISAGVQDSEYIKSFRIDNNKINFSGSSFYKFGIYGASIKSDGAQIINNMVRGAAYGIYVNGSAVLSNEHMLISGNDLSESSIYGGYLWYIAKSRIVNNVFKNSTAAVMTTATDSIAIGTGSKSFTVDLSQNFYTTQSVKVYSTSGPTNWMRGTVTSYDSATGALLLNVATTGGSGTYTDWSVVPDPFALNLRTVTNSKFERNDISDDQTSASQLWGAVEDSGCIGNTYIDNIVFGNTTGFIKLYSASGSKIVTNDTIVASLTGDYTFLPGQAHTYFLDPGGSNRNFSPGAAGTYGPFPEGYIVCLVNTADAAETITVDPSGINVPAAQNKSGCIIYTGSAFRQMTTMAP